MDNLSTDVVKGFGDEWNRFSQSNLSDYEDIDFQINSYFNNFPFESLSNENSCGFDAGCGSGRWAKYMSKHCRKLLLVEPSAAINVAKKNLVDINNLTFFNETVENAPIKESSTDFGYCLGVIHHTCSPQSTLNTIASWLKPGAPLQLYVYYNLENKPLLLRYILRIVSVFRYAISSLPSPLKFFICDLIALLIYYPCARISKLLEALGINPINFPLSFYRHRSFYSMRTDSLDRFGTKLELRFSRDELVTMCRKAGLENIIFSDNEPFWCLTAYRSI